jgi:hypothetical protein
MTPPDNIDIFQRYRSGNDVVYEILDDLGLDADENYMLYVGKCLRWIVRGNIAMGAAVAYANEQFTGYIENCMVKKPCDFVKLLEVRVGHCHIVPMYTAANKFMCDAGCRNYNREFYDTHFTVSESQNSLDFSSNANGEPVYMRYLSYQHDENGFPMVDSTYYEAVVAFCRYKYAVSRGDNRENEFFSKWEYLKKQARARYTDMSMDTYFIDQVLSKFNDPLYVKTSPYARQIQNHNTVRAHAGILGTGTGLNIVSTF